MGRGERATSVLGRLFRRGMPFVLGAGIMIGAVLALDWRDARRAIPGPLAEGAVNHGQGLPNDVPSGMPRVPTIDPTIRAHPEAQVTATAAAHSAACGQVVAEYARVDAVPDARKGAQVLTLEILGFYNVRPSDHGPFAEYARRYFGDLVAACYG
jgi:hypothetical protein